MILMVQNDNLSDEERKEGKAFRDKKRKEEPDNPFTKKLDEENLGDKVMDILVKGDPLEYLLKTIICIHVGDLINIAWHILSGLSSGLNDRRQLIHLAITGNSGKGKSSIQDHVGLIFEDMETVTSSSAKYNITLMALLFTILIIIVALIYSNRISKPIKKLTFDVDEISKGKFDVQLQKSNIKEVQILTDSLNRVLSSMKLAILRTGKKDIVKLDYQENEPKSKSEVPSKKELEEVLGKKVLKKKTKKKPARKKIKKR
jgi:methyl-accepting chemotaxis protein